MTDLHKTIEPVAWTVAYVDLDFLKEDLHAYAFVKRHNPWQTPLYTKPPSVDALIGEIDASCRAFGNSGYYYQTVGVDALLAILDKYKGVK